MEAGRSSETSVNFQRATWRYIPEDSTLHNHLCEKLKSYYCNARWKFGGNSYFLIPLNLSSSTSFMWIQVNIVQNMLVQDRHNDEYPLCYALRHLNFPRDPLHLLSQTHIDTFPFMIIEWKYIEWCVEAVCLLTLSDKPPLSAQVNTKSDIYIHKFLRKISGKILTEPKHQAIKAYREIRGKTPPFIKHHYWPRH
jgi:hypothetical protein